MVIQSHTGTKGITNRDPSHVTHQKRKKSRKNRKKNLKNSAETISEEKATKTTPTQPTLIGQGQNHVAQTRARPSQRNRPAESAGSPTDDDPKVQEIVGKIKIREKQNEAHENGNDDHGKIRKKLTKNSDINQHRPALVQTTGETVPTMVPVQVNHHVSHT